MTPKKTGRKPSPPKLCAFPGCDLPAKRSSFNYHSKFHYHEAVRRGLAPKPLRATPKAKSTKAQGPLRPAPAPRPLLGTPLR